MHIPVCGMETGAAPQETATRPSAEHTGNLDRPGQGIPAHPMTGQPRAAQASPGQASRCAELAAAFLSSLRRQLSSRPCLPAALPHQAGCSPGALLHLRLAGLVGKPGGHEKQGCQADTANNELALVQAAKLQGGGIMAGMQAWGQLMEKRDVMGEVMWGAGRRVGTVGSATGRGEAGNSRVGSAGGGKDSKQRRRQHQRRCAGKQASR